MGQGGVRFASWTAEGIPFRRPSWPIVLGLLSPDGAKDGAELVENREGRSGTVEKLLALVTAIVENGQSPTGTRALAKKAGVPISSAHRYLQSMVASGLARTTTEGLVVGPELERIARLVVGLSAFPGSAQHEIDELAVRTGETVLLAIYDYEQKRMMFVAQAEGRHSLRYVIPLHEWISPLEGASGLGIISFLSEDDLTALLEGHPASDAIRLEIQKVRDGGVATSYGQRIAGAVGIAAPLFGPDGRVLGDVSLTLPEIRFDVRKHQSLSDQVRSCADRISRSLGAPEDPRVSTPEAGETTSDTGS